MMEKIGELLSDGESLKQLSELAQILTSEADGENSEAPDTEKTEQNTEADSDESSEGLFSGGFDLSSLIKLQEIMGAMSQSDKNSELLLALKPHLSEERRQKVDKAIKLMKLIAVWNIVKGSGLINDLF